MSSWRSTIRFRWITVTSGYASWYDHRCCQELKLQQPNQTNFFPSNFGLPRHGFELTTSNAESIHSTTRLSGHLTFPHPHSTSRPKGPRSQAYNTYTVIAHKAYITCALMTRLGRSVYMVVIPYAWSLQFKVKVGMLITSSHQSHCANK